MVGHADPANPSHEDTMLTSTLRLTLATLALAATTLSAQAQDRHLRIHNDTGLTLY